MFTVAVLAKEECKHLCESFGFVKCQCQNCFPFDFESRENCKKDFNVMTLVCPSCKYESHEVIVPKYTDQKGVEHGSMKYQLVYLNKVFSCDPTA